jgi:hypothetical protein
LKITFGGDQIKATIYQPTYLPWSGFFGMIDLVDVFVIFDDVQFVKDSWQRRNKLKFQNSERWISVPIIKNFGQKINQVKINNSINWRDDHSNKIYDYYNKSPFYDDYESKIHSFYEREWEYLVDLNMTIIKDLSKILGLNIPKFVKSSEIDGDKGQKTDRILYILEKIGADESIVGPTARTYTDKQKFADKNIQLYWYEFNHPVYPQLEEEFIPYLSVIDLIFNNGENAINYIRKGNNNALKSI